MNRFAVNRLLAISGALLVCLASSICAKAADWPNRPVKVIVAFTAGSATDIIARLVFQEVSSQIGQPIVIENRGGAGGTIGSAAVAKSDPDGYTILVNAAGHAAAPWVYRNLSYDTERDLTGITPLAKIPNVLVVAPDGDYSSVQDLVKAAKAKPGTITYASSGIASASQLNAERFRLSAGFQAVHVPFRGAQEGLTEVMTRRVDFFFIPATAAMSLIQGGKLKALAVGTSTRAAVLPNVPTTVESGYLRSDYNFWMGIFVPGKTPSDIIDRIHHETVKALEQPAIKAKLSELGAEPMVMSPVEFGAYIKREIADNEAIIRGAGLIGK
jgi:tripartite-type tricarboxylate transporter receptor subunit TctC